MRQEYEGGLVGVLQSIERYLNGRTVYEADTPNHNIINRKTFTALMVAIGIPLGVVAYVRHKPTHSIQRRTRSRRRSSSTHATSATIPTDTVDSEQWSEMPRAYWAI